MGAEPTATRESKHMSIFHAIDQLKNTRSHLQRLVDDVIGKDPEEKEKETISNPSLLKTLDDSGSEIVNLCDEINGTINELRELIL